MKVIISAGGTGGHIYPAIAIINKIKEMDKSSEILYIGTQDRMEKDIIPNLHIPYEGIEMHGINRKNIFSNIKVYFTYRKAIKKAREIIKNFKPDIVIGVGGYITAPVIIAAHKEGIKTLIHEQNAFPGVSNKHLAKYADKICVSLPDTLTSFGASKCIYTGNPRSEEIIKVPAAKKEKFGLSDSKKLVIIVMGSLGSTTMTKKLKELIPAFKGKNYQVIIITGKTYYDEYRSVLAPDNVGVVPYLDNLINLMKKTDLIISRAGASTIAEITAIGLPSILVPSPYVTNNHQLLNAKELENIGACKIIEEKDFSKETVIKEIDNIIMNPGVYKGMKLATKSLGIPDSATRIYSEIKKLVKTED